MEESLNTFITNPVSMRKNNKGSVDIILMAVVAAIVIAISLIIVYSVIGGLDTATIDADLTGTPSFNATDNLLDNLGTFYTIAPIYLVVLAAVAIIAAIMMIMVKRK